MNVGIDQVLRGGLLLAFGAAFIHGEPGLAKQPAKIQQESKQKRAKAASPHEELIVPGRGVGSLKLGDSREQVFKIFPFKQDMDEEYTYATCGRREIHWLDRERDMNGVFVFLHLRQDRVFQIESSTTRFRTAEGVTFRSSPKLLRKHFPNMRAFVLLHSGGKEVGGRDLIYWVNEMKGIAFELYYDGNFRERRVSSIIVFEPEASFRPRGCVVEPQEWTELRPYSQEPNVLPPTEGPELPYDQRRK